MHGGDRAKARWVVRTSVGLGLLALAAAAEAAAPQSALAPDQLHPLVAALHVHSTWSTGTLTLDELAERAERLGIDAIVLSENFALRFEYGLPPLRGSLRATVSAPSLSADRAEAFLRDIAAVQARHPAVLFIPGVEVVPHYYWTGSLLSGDLTMHNAQRNLLVIGLRDPEDYAALPTIGNPSSYRLGRGTFVSLTPGLLLFPAGWLWRQQGRRARSGRKLLAAVFALAGVALLANAWPFTQPTFTAYDTDAGYRPDQTVIDAATERGGVVIWSLPEARDHNHYDFGPFGAVTVQTPPHPDALLQTTGYTGFGGVYQDTRQLTEPGGIWDLTLAQFLAGRRVTLPVLTGEIAFHAPGQAGVFLHGVLNVLQARDRSVEGVLDAIRAGRLYAVGQYQDGVPVRLTEFSIAHETAGLRARAGDILRTAGDAVLTVAVAVEATGAQRHPLAFTLIRSGKTIASAAGVTPFRYQHVEKIENPVKAAFYRVKIVGKGIEILSNPIFVGPFLERAYTPDDEAEA